MSLEQNLERISMLVLGKRHAVQSLMGNIKVGGEFSEAHILNREIDNQAVNIVIHSGVDVVPAHYRKKEVILLCVDLTDEQGLVDLKNLINLANRHVGDNSKFVIIGTNPDSPERKISETELTKFAESVKMPSLEMPKNSEQIINDKIVSISREVLAARSAAPAASAASAAPARPKIITAFRQLFNKQDKKDEGGPSKDAEKKRQPRP